MLDAHLNQANKAPAAKTEAAEATTQEEAPAQEVVESADQDASFDSIKLSKTAQKALEKAGYTTLAEVKKLTEAQLSEIDGLTAASIKKILA